MNKSDISPKNIELIVYDFDGVMTDNTALIFEDGTEAVFVNRSDGLAIAKIKEIDIPQVIISTERNSIVTKRGEKLKIPVYQNIGDKLTCLKEVIETHQVSPQNTIYVGNDTNDLEAMKFVGWPIAPKDAHEQIKALAKFITDSPGGSGVIREILDLLTGKL
ncbi:haloacid dehalogenase [Candidatus Marinimicrobia bacterium MT.SAG.3]|nr:haloacid dehalogenase [Candidatus Marinimicrobia bacterium MT.SAG.3]